MCPHYDGINVSLPNSCDEFMSLKMMVLEDVAFGKWLSHGGRSLMKDGIIVFIKEAPQSSPTPPTMWGHTHISTLQASRGPVLEPNHVNNLTLNFQHPETREVNCYCL